MDKVVSLRWFLGIFTAAFICFVWPIYCHGNIEFSARP